MPPLKVPGIDGITFFVVRRYTPPGDVPVNALDLEDFLYIVRQRTSTPGTDTTIIVELLITTDEETGTLLILGKMFFLSANQLYIGYVPINVLSFREVGVMFTEKLAGMVDEINGRRGRRGEEKVE